MERIGNYSFGMYLTQMFWMTVGLKVLRNYMTFPYNYIFTVVMSFIGMYIANKVLRGKLSSIIGF